MSRLQDIYKKEVMPKMIQNFGYGNINQVPMMEKAVVNVGVGSLQGQEKAADKVAENLATITGQRPVSTKAKKSIAGFKLRSGDKVGLQVTLRGNKMYDFIDRLVNLTLPRIRDFRGLNPKSFDGHGNYSLGIKELVVFPEISYDNIEFVHGMQISIHTNAKTDEEARGLLSLLGFPFQKES